MNNQRELWNRYVANAQQRPQNLQELAQTGKTLNQLYADRLKMTLNLIEQKRAGEWGLWDDRKATREEQLRKLLEGQPDKIPEVWRGITN